MQNLTLREILDQIRKSHFYLMYLRYGNDHSESSHRDLWEFSRRNDVIGLSHHLVKTHWRDVSTQVRREIGRTWTSHFQTFSGLRQGDLVFVPDGQTKLLGIGLVKDDSYDYKPDLRGFFRHVRSVDWLVGYPWKDRPEIPRLWGFDKTIQYVDNRSRVWPDIIRYRVSLGVDLLHPTADSTGSIRKKYGPGGEGKDHKQLKDYLYDHPEAIGLDDVVDKQREYVFRTGDRADLVFELTNGRYVIVEVETDNQALIDAGAYQALKYRILKCAEKRTPITSDSVRSLLVAWQDPTDTTFCQDYDVRFIRKKL